MIVRLKYFHLIYIITGDRLRYRLREKSAANNFNETHSCHSFIRFIRDSLLFGDFVIEDEQFLYRAATVRFAVDIAAGKYFVEMETAVNCSGSYARM